MAHDVVPVDQRGAGVGSQQRREDADERRLAGAVRAEQALDRPLGNVEVDAGERTRLAERLGDAADLDDGHGARLYRPAGLSPTGRWTAMHGALRLVVREEPVEALARVAEGLLRGLDLGLGAGLCDLAGGGHQTEGQLAEPDEIVVGVLGGLLPRQGAGARSAALVRPSSVSS